MGGFNCRSIAFVEPNFKSKLLELTLKLSGNDLIEHESKSLVQFTSQILKDELRVNEYFKAVSDFEDRKRQGKAEDKIRMAELAILDPEEFASEKRGKKRKVE